MRHFLSASEGVADRRSYLDRILASGKAAYPSEDGWTVLDLSRMQTQTAIVKPESEPAAAAVAYQSIKTPQGAGSLAEAILQRNPTAALALIIDRPMIALADATADLDAVYRQRRGLTVIDAMVSELLKREAERYSAEELESIIRALTSAIDGTFTDELSAVKLAIMKAISLAKKA